MGTAIPGNVTQSRRKIRANSGRIAILMRPIIRAILSGSALRRLPTTMVSMEPSPTALPLVQLSGYVFNKR
jgi:hypothetical protein